MKIVHTEASLGYGGQEMRIVTEAAGLSRRGHEVALLCPPQAQILALAQSHGVSVEALDIGRKKISSVMLLRHWLQSAQADVVNTHSSTDSWLVALATRWMPRRPAIVRTRHISAPVPDNLTSRWLYTHSCDHVVTTGENLRQTLITTNGFPAEHVTSVRTGIDLDRFRPGDSEQARAALGLPQNAFIVGIVATLRSWKGHRYLLEAIAEIGDEDCLLLVVGDGPQDEALHQLVAELGIRQRVIFAGRQENVASWMQAMDIFCLPSYANEGVPQALMQSQACAIPAVTTLNGSIDEAVIPDETAIIVKPKDSGAIAQAIRRLQTDPAQRETMARAAAANARANFSVQQMADSMEQIFLQAIAARNS